MARILTELEAREAAINGATVRYRRSPPYLTCPLCGGDGTSERPRLIGCSCPRDPGWETIDELGPEIVVNGAVVCGWDGMARAFGLLACDAVPEGEALVLPGPYPRRADHADERSWHVATRAWWDAVVRIEGPR